jgi:hypothetical protein
MDLDSSSGPAARVEPTEHGGNGALPGVAEQHLGAFVVLEGPAAALSRAFVAQQVPAGVFAVCRHSTWGPLWWDGCAHPDRERAEAAARTYAEQRTR